MLSRAHCILLLAGLIGGILGCAETTAQQPEPAPKEVRVRAEGIRLSALTSDGEIVTVSAGHGTWMSGVARLQDVSQSEGVVGERGEVVLVHAAAEVLSVNWEAAGDEQP